MKRDIGTVAVTGGSSGLGLSVVRQIIGAGGTPVVIDRAEPPVEVDHEVVDLADGRAAERAVERIVDRHGELCGMVTAAGIDACGRLEDVPGDQWDQVLAVNLLGTAAVVRAAIGALERGSGRIVTVASTLGLRPVSDATAYCASKFGVVGFTRALATELDGRVGVSLLVPGGMATSFFDGRTEQYRPGPDAKLNDPEVVADAVLFVLAQPDGCEVRELVVCPTGEPSWP
jgi:NAD(P)-dependent dehydrogenase (short-subunit alcohol dehydrogenase family)